MAGWAGTWSRAPSARGRGTRRPTVPTTHPPRPPASRLQQKGGMDHWNFLRKPASDFGWDWGPAFAPCGVAGGVSLEVYSAAHLAGATLRQEHLSSGDVVLGFDAVLRTAGRGLERGVLGRGL